MKTALVSVFLLLPRCALAQPTAPAVTERGPHHRVWRWTTEQTGPDGRTRAEPHSYVELATGLCYQRDGQGPWLDAQEVIEVLPDGSGVARQGQHQVEFPVNLKDGVIGLRTPKGKQFRSRPLWLAYFDAATGQSVLIAELQDTPGQLIAPNTVLYPNTYAAHGLTTTYTHDALNRLTHINYPHSPDITLQYDPLGRRTGSSTAARS